MASGSQPTDLEPREGLLIADRYRLLRHIGSGGMGTVWSAEDTRMRRSVALKMLVPGGPDDTEHKRFLREARAASAVRHPHVVEILDVFDVGQRTPVLVMELLEGESLKDRLARCGTLSLAETCEIMLPILSAVATAHARGIVHRDLKPANIFLERERDGVKGVKVLDFGIAKLAARTLGAESGDLTQTGRMLGSPPYMSPEQAFCDRDIDHRTDIWSLGIVLYECLSGILPTRAENTGQVLKIITKGGIPPLSRAVPSLPADIADLVDRMLSEAPSARPADLSEVQATLARHAEPQSAGLADSFTPHERATGADRAAAPNARRNKSNRILSAWLLAVVPLILVAVKIWPARDEASPGALGSGAVSSSAQAAPAPHPTASSQEDASPPPVETSRESPPAQGTGAPSSSARPRVAAPPPVRTARPEPTSQPSPLSTDAPGAGTAATPARPTAESSPVTPEPAPVEVPPTPTLRASSSGPTSRRLTLDTDNPYQPKRPADRPDPPPAR